MNSLVEAKNELTQCRSRDRLYSVLSDLCEQAGFDYNMARGFGFNASRARDRQMFSVAELIKHGEKMEGRL